MVMVGLLRAANSRHKLRISWLMPITSEFVRLVNDAFDPFLSGAGTEHIALFLYSLTRMTRPRTVVEYGSGYTTLYLLAALADNACDFREEAMLIREKTIALGDIANLTHNDPKIQSWYQAGGKAMAADPGYYLGSYRPQLFSFEEFGEGHQYTQRMRRIVSQLQLTNYFSYIIDTCFTSRAIPDDCFPVDLAWNDHGFFKDFFGELWPLLNPAGGLMVFHNSAANSQLWEAIQWMKEQRASKGDLEVLTLVEPHKLNQNSCTILRRTTQYRPQFVTRTHDDIREDAMRLSKTTNPS
jgi:hypothetical protein